MHTLDEQILHVRGTEIQTNPRSIIGLHLYTAHHSPKVWLLIVGSYEPKQNKNGEYFKSVTS